MANERRAPKELTEGFWLSGVSLEDDVNPCGCWLRQHDPADIVCNGKLEVFHFVGRQRIRNVLAGQLPSPMVEDPLDGGLYFPPNPQQPWLELAEWDARNAGPACVAHHRRLDSHATPDLTVPYAALPKRVIEFAEDWGLESALEERYPR